MATPRRELTRPSVFSRRKVIFDRIVCGMWHHPLEPNILRIVFFFCRPNRTYYPLFLQVRNMPPRCKKIFVRKISFHKNLWTCVQHCEGSTYFSCCVSWTPYGYRCEVQVQNVPQESLSSWERREIKTFASTRESIWIADTENPLNKDLSWQIRQYINTHKRKRWEELVRSCNLLYGATKL